MFLDLGVGIIIAVLLSKIFDVGLTAQVILPAVVFSLLPDLDVFVELWKRGRVGGKIHGHHRELTHFPLTYLPLVLFIWFFAGSFWAILFGAAILAHFLHDSIGMGWGIKWLWPFSKKTYKFFSEKDGRFSKNFIVCWQPEELEKIVLEHGDNHWVKNFYLKFHPLALFELVVFLMAVAVLYVFR